MSKRKTKAQRRAQSRKKAVKYLVAQYGYHVTQQQYAEAREKAAVIHP